MINFVSVCVGSKYTPDYVAILHDQVARNLSTVDHAHWCITDDPESLPEGVNAIPHHPDYAGWWQKLYLFSGDMPWSEGERVFFLDLDTAVTGRLEDLVERKGIMLDWHTGALGSACMVWDHGEHRVVWESMHRLDPEQRKAEQERVWGDQDWLTEVSRPEWDMLPPEWTRSYRAHARDWPPTDCKIVCLHGKPKPHEIVDGWVPNVWKIGGWTSIPEMKGANVDQTLILDQVRANTERDLPWFSGFGDHARSAVICAPGPSLKDSLKEIRWHQRNGATVISLNNALGYLSGRKITPDAHVMLDARPENIAFLENAPEGVKYFLASQCHPSLFDRLADRDVVLWHNMVGDEMREIVKPYEDSKPIVLVPGGGTVGLRAINLCWLSGYRTIHLYGMDGSYSGDDHHVTPQPLNEGEMTVQVMMDGKPFRCALWMARQAEEFQSQYRGLRSAGVQIFAHGAGLIPSMVRWLRAEERKAA